MKLIYFAPRFPLPITGGDRLLTERYLRYLGERWEVHFLGFIDAESSDSRLAGELKRSCALASVETIPLGLARVSSAVRGSVRRWPLQTGYYYRREVERRLRALIARVRPDAVLFQTVRLLPYLDAVPAGIHRLVHFVDALSENYRRSASVARSIPHRLLYLHESRRLLEAEHSALSVADASYAVSEADAAYLNGLSPSRSPVQVVPMGIDAEYYHPRPLADEPRGRIAFLGRMSTRANADAAVWFAREVLPPLRRRLGIELHFTVVGAEPAKRVRDIGSRTVTVTGSVSDVRPFLWDSDLTVAPMRIATGIQNKILLSLALGRPVVASSSCAEGIGRGLEGLLVADGVEETVGRIAEVYTQYGSLRATMPRVSAAITDAFSWESSLGAFAASVERMIETRISVKRAEPSVLR